jgi:hypothetical protein
VSDGSLKQFQEDYPEVYEKFLEMNRALARLLRDRVAADSNPISERFPMTADDLPTELEWD